jgi:2-polyprenyl-3-methyl-5-hydroxy-6-metoxy-1,4-benzoquinol methylase
MNYIHYKHCPVCGSTDLTEKFKVKDYTVSGETFAIIHCSSCQVRLTQDVPDQASILPYYKSEDYISHSDTTKGFINRLYHIVRKTTLRQKRKLIERATMLSKGRVLDIGSGTGAFLHGMKTAGWEVIGLEPDPSARSLAKSRYGIDIADMSEIDKLESGSFQVITLWHVLEHVHDLIAYIQRLRQLLADGGRIFIALPNYTSLDGNVYREHWAAYDAPRHLYHFCPNAMLALAKRNELTITHIKPMWYDSFYISMLSSRYKNGKTNWIGACWTALRSNMRAAGNTKYCSSVIYIIRK